MSGTERFRRLLALGAALALASCAGGAPEEALPAAEPESPYQRALDRGIALGLPGVVVAIDRSGEEPWLEAVGKADLSEERELTIDDPFHQASVTKAITAVAVLRMIDRGELRLDDRIVEILPDATTDGLPAAERITIRHLLEHSSGLYSFNNNREYWSRLIGAEAFSGRRWSTDELLDFVRANPPSGEPGSGFYYADTNYLLLGEIVTSVAGRPFREVVRDDVFEELGMSSTYFYSSYLDGTEVGVRAPVEGYLVMSEVMQTFNVHPDFPEISEGVLEATAAHERSDTAAGVVSTASDMLRFARALFRPGFLADASRELLFEPTVSVEAGDAASDGGVLRAYRRRLGVLLTAEGDGPGGVHTLLAYHPSTDTIVVAFTNSFGRFDETDYFDEVVAEVIGARASS